MGLEMFRKMADKAKMLKKQYVEKFGPIVAEDVDSTEEWAWVCDPWPWNN